MVYAIAAGVAFAWMRTHYAGKSFGVPAIRGLWLLVVAMVPQLIVFFVPGVQRLAIREVASVVLVVSQLLLLLFVWQNRNSPGFWVLGLGLFMNFVVIVINGGLMPISLETVQRLAPAANLDQLEIGERLGSSKDILLNEDQIRLAFLSDRFTFPGWFPHRVAFSIGDILIAIGIMLFFWQGSYQPQTGKEA